MMSILKREWRLLNTDRVTSLLQKLLLNRGLHTEEEVDRFLNPSAARDFHDPFLMEDMEKAVRRIGVAIENSERIMIFGDYDVDGITGSAILMRALRKLGANVSYRLPHRVEDGYGLREKFIREFKKLDVKLVVTVDNGISCANEVETANKLGIDVIITDHHTVPERVPDAFAILHPKLQHTRYPFSELTGSAVALKLAQALFIRRTENPEENLAPMFDLACMGTITDFGELRGENRYIVKEGLRALANTRWPGLSRLKKVAGINGNLIGTHDIGFLLGPRINAAGRIAHPSHALRLLLHDSSNAGPLADLLEDFNRKRQKLTEDLMEIACELAGRQTNAPIIIVHHKNFHSGVIGLLAAKLVEKFGKSAIVMEERGEILVGSCRVVPGINIIQSLTQCAKMLTHFGGHAAAAGFDIEMKNLATFKDKMASAIAEQIPDHASLPPVLNIDCEISPTDISLETASMIQELAPFGAGNSTPRFLLRRVPIMGFSLIGKTKKHLKMISEFNGGSVDVVGFGFGEYLPQIRNARELDIVCEVEKNEWNGSVGVQLKLIDVGKNFGD